MTWNAQAAPLRLEVLALREHGLCVVIQTPNGKVFCVDTGQPGDTNTVLTHLRCLGVRVLDGLLVSHPHNDHQGGVRAILGSYKVRTFWVGPTDRLLPERWRTAETELAAALRSAASAAGAEVREVARGDRLEWDPDLDVHVLWPPRELWLHESHKSPHAVYNDNSVVLRVRHGSCSVLLPGDIGTTAAEELVRTASESLKCDVLVVPHHGFFSHRKFYETVAPTWAVVSCIVDYPDHPVPNTPARTAVDLLAPLRARIWVTPWQGTVRVESDGQKLRLLADSKSGPDR